MVKLLEEHEKYSAKIKKCGYLTIKAAKGMKYYA
jgi:hypothetical protein